MNAHERQKEGDNFWWMQVKELKWSWKDEKKCQAFGDVVKE